MKGLADAAFCEPWIDEGGFQKRSFIVVDFRSAFHPTLAGREFAQRRIEIAIAEVFDAFAFNRGTRREVPFVNAGVCKKLWHGLLHQHMERKFLLPQFCGCPRFVTGTDRDEFRIRRFIEHKQDMGTHGRILACWITCKEMLPRIVCKTG